MTKDGIALFSSNSKEAKHELEPVVAAGNENGGFREKVFDFSLDLRQIRPSAVFGPRRRTALRGEGYAWTPDL